MNEIRFPNAGSTAFILQEIRFDQKSGTSFLLKRDTLKSGRRYICKKKDIHFYKEDDTSLL